MFRIETEKKEERKMSNLPSFLGQEDQIYFDEESTTNLNHYEKKDTTDYHFIFSACFTTFESSFGRQNKDKTNIKHKMKRTGSTVSHLCSEMEKMKLFTSPKTKKHIKKASVCNKLAQLSLSQKNENQE